MIEYMTLAEVEERKSEVEAQIDELQEDIERLTARQWALKRELFCLNDTILRFARIFGEQV